MCGQVKVANRARRQSGFHKIEPTGPGDMNPTKKLSKKSIVMCGQVKEDMYLSYIQGVAAPVRALPDQWKEVRSWILPCGNIYSVWVWKCRALVSKDLVGSRVQLALDKHGRHKYSSIVYQVGLLLKVGLLSAKSYCKRSLVFY